VGVIQATEAIKLLLGKGQSLSGRLLLIDALAMSFRELKIRRDPECPVCGDHPTIRELIDYETFCGVHIPGESDDEVQEITASELVVELQRNPRLRLLDVRNPPELDISRLDGALTIPLNQIAQRAAELDPAVDLVVFCRSGVRSRQAIEQLRELGFDRLTNLKGGILAWADEVDPEMAKY
jgi:adenylyltransferase/sulfurtransferase